MINWENSRLWVLRIAGFAMLITSTWLIFTSVKDGRKQNIWEGFRSLPDQNFYAIDARFTGVGKKYALTDFSNKVSVVAFVYLNCPTFCPKIMAEMKKLHSELGENAVNVNFLIFTFDDVSKTPSELSEFKNRYHLQGNSWKILTSAEKDFKKLAQVFNLKYSVVPGSKPNYIHTNLIALIQKDGKIFTADYGLQKGAENLAKNILSRL